MMNIEYRILNVEMWTLQVLACKRETFDRPKDIEASKITDATGRIIKTVEVTGTQGQYVWDTREVKPGVYFYSFVVNGSGTTSKLVITK